MKMLKTAGESCFESCLTWSLQGHMTAMCDSHALDQQTKQADRYKRLCQHKVQLFNRAAFIPDMLLTDWPAGVSVGHHNRNSQPMCPHLEYQLLIVCAFVYSLSEGAFG